MIPGLADLALPFLRGLDPERAHALTLNALEAGFYIRQALPDDPRLAQTVWGLDFPNPVGMAAGFDKDARVPQALLDIGFGFVEAGTVTPRPQPGNPRPRVFRLLEDRALINRLGFNSEGHATVRERLEQRAARARRRGLRGVVGVNIGANTDSEDKAADYISGLEAFADQADYFTINISSPNTPGLRDLQAPDALDALLGQVMAKRNELAAGGAPRRPVAVKLAPDLEDDDLAPVCERLLAHGVDGIIVSNTTLSRPALKNAENAHEAGGLSGAPLFDLSTRMLAKVYVLTQSRVPLIGVGGIDSGQAALQKVQAGASLIQLYTGLVYEGPGLIVRIKQGLLTGMERAGAASIGDVTGTKAEEWAAKKRPQE